MYIAQIEDKFEINLVSLRILGMVSRLMFIVHILGCFWFYVAWTVMEAGSHPNTWVQVYNDGSAVDGPVSEQYLFSIYWALTTLTTIGYGDITPQNNTEMVYCLFAELVGAMMFGYMMSTIGSMVTQMDREAQLKEDRMDAVKEWMASRNIPHKLFVRVRKYYEHYYSRKSAFDEVEILSALTPALKSDVTRVLLRDSLGNFPLFALLGVEFQQHVYPRLKPVAYANMDVVYHKGEVSSDFFFLRKGTIDVLASGVGSEVLYRISHGQYFGEEVLTHQRRGCSVVSNGFTEMWSLSKDVLEETMDLFPELVPKLDEFANRLKGLARRNGAISTAAGRQRQLPHIASSNRAECAKAERQAVNTAVQGSAADLMKQAMIDVARELRAQAAGASLIAQIHDEVLIEAREDEAHAVAQIVQTGMEAVWPASNGGLLLPVSVTIGRSWGEMAKWTGTA